MRRVFSSRQSLPLLLGAALLAGVTFVIVRGGGKAVDGVSANAGATDSPNGRELVTIRFDSKWKLKRASWGSVTVPEPPPAPEHDESEVAPEAEKWDGLDVAVTGR
jgi:hypothetical protein